MYVTEKRVNKNKKFIPLDPQPRKSAFLEVHRFYQILHVSPPRTIAISQEDTQLFEQSTGNDRCCGIHRNFPGEEVSRERKAKRCESNLPPNSTLSEQKTEVSFGTRTGKNVVPKANRGAVDDHDRQRNEKQLRNLKYLINREKTKVSGTNAAENITKVEEMTKTHSFVKTVKYIRDVSHPVVTIITDRQIVDLKRLCCKEKELYYHPFSCDPNNLQRPIHYKTIDDGQSIIFGTDIYSHNQHNKGI